MLGPNAGMGPAMLPGMAPPPPEETPAARKADEILRDILGLLDELKVSEDTDDQEMLIAEKMGTMAQQMLAQAQQQAEAAMGVSPALKGMRRAIGAPAQPGGSY